MSRSLVAEAVVGLDCALITKAAVGYDATLVGGTSFWVARSERTLEHDSQPREPQMP